ncbi:MAG: S-layer homology domain-containing protein [Candidatus Gracilibacteria bacterium]|jgi:hypothetical protein|nr:S-layer homology domain-containing protein [Candidatus Gracilibacteria bacterium]
MKIKNKILFLIFSLLFVTGSVFASDDDKYERPEYEGTLLDKPIITNVTFEENKRKEGFLMTVSGKNFLQFKDNVNFRLVATGEKNKELDITGEIENKMADKILVKLPENIKSGPIYVEIRHNEQNETVKSDPYIIDIPAPEIYFIYGENGILPGQEVELYGKNFSGVFVKTQLDIDHVTHYTVLDNKISFRVPHHGFDGEIQVIRDGLKSNKLDLKKLFPPILKRVSFIEKSGEDQDLIKVKAANIPDDKNKVRIHIGKKTATIEEFDFDNKGDAIITAKMPKPVDKNSEIRVEISGVDSNSIIHEFDNAPEVTSFEYKGKEDGLDVFDLYANNLSSDDDLLELKIGGTKISNDDFFRFHNKIRILTDAKVSTKGDVEITNDKKYVSDPFEFNLEEDLEPRIYSVSAPYGFHDGAPFYVNGVNFGNTSKDVQLIVSGASIDKNFGFAGKQTKGTKISSKFELKESVTKNETTKNVSITVSIKGKKSNTIVVPYGGGSKIKEVLTTPIITDVEFPNGRNPGKKIVINGRNFARMAKQNIIIFGSEEIKAESINNRKTKLEVTIPELFKSGMIKVKRTEPDEQESPPFELRITNAKESTFSVSFEDIEEDKEDKEKNTIEIDTEQEKLILAKMRVKNFISDISVNELQLKMELKEGNPDSEYSMANLHIAPFSNIYLKKKNKNIAGPGVILQTNNGIYVKFENFDIDLTESEEGEEYEIEGVVLPFLSDSSQIKFIFEGKMSALNKDKNNGVTISKKTIKSPLIKVINPISICVEPKKEKDEKERCPDILAKVALKNAGEKVKIDFTEDEEEVDEQDDQKDQIADTTDTGSTTIVAPIEKKDPKDLDGDGVKDIEEVFLGTSSSKADSDGDGVNDGEELFQGTNPSQSGLQKIFSDFSEAEWATEYITKLKLFGVIKLSGKFEPNLAITRGEFIQMAVDAFRKEALPVVAFNPFVDVPKNLNISAHVLYAKNKGVVNGYSDKTFRPDSTITRAEAVKILLGLKGINTISTTSVFKDLDSWQIPFVEKAKSMGVVKGFSDTEFKPNDNLTRAQSSKMIYNLIWQ